MRRPLDVARALAALLIAAALLAPAAAAHTHLASTTPPDGASTAVAPRAIVLRFTQPIDPRTAVLRVVDETGRLLPTAATTGDDGRVRLALRGALANGTYAVGYRVLATDGHAMKGGLTFTVAARRAAAAGGGRNDAAATVRGVDRRARREPGGAAALLRDAVPRDAPWTAPALIAARAGQYAGLVLGLGGVTFLLLAWWPAMALASSTRRDPGEPTWRATLRVAIAIGAVSAAGGLVVHAFDAAGAAPTAARVAGGLHDHAAILWAEAAACWAGAGLLLRRAPALAPRTAKRLLAPLAGALLATALSGHGGSDGDILAAVAAIVHGTAATIWIGAIAWLMLAARRGGERGAVRRAIVPAAAARVSRLALGAALATLASGLVQALALAGGPLTLAASGYGQLILAKLALFGLLVVLGAVHRRRTLPVLAAPARTRPLRATLRAELVIAAALLATAGTLTGSAPPQPGPAGTPAALAAGR